MAKEVVIHIGKETGDLAVPPFRAYISWLEDGILCSHVDYSEAELLREIELAPLEGSDREILVDALERLRKI